MRVQAEELVALGQGTCEQAERYLIINITVSTTTTTTEGIRTPINMNPRPIPIRQAPQLRHIKHIRRKPPGIHLPRAHNNNTHHPLCLPPFQLPLHSVQIQPPRLPHPPHPNILDTRMPQPNNTRRFRKRGVSHAGEDLYLIQPRRATGG